VIEVNNSCKSHRRKVVEMELSFPYDWSNPEISDFALIWKVLEHEIFEDVMRICWYFGIDAIRAVHQKMPHNDLRDLVLMRMMNNIQKGFDIAQKEAAAC